MYLDSYQKFFCTFQQLDFSCLRQSFYTSLLRNDSVKFQFTRPLSPLDAYICTLLLRKGNKSKGESDIKAFKRANTLIFLDFYICIFLTQTTHPWQVSFPSVPRCLHSRTQGQGAACPGALLENRQGGLCDGT